MKVLKCIACLLIGGGASRAEVRAALDLDQQWSQPSNLQKLKTGSADTTLCPEMVPKKGEKWEFNVRQYKNSALEKMSYHWVLHKVNGQKVDISVGAAQGQNVYNNDGKGVWKTKRHFGAARFFGKRFTDSLYMLTGGHAEFTLRRIAMTIPQRWTVHNTHTYGGTPGTEGYRSYDDTRMYWIKGHRGKYNVFKNPEDSREWTNAGKKKRKSISHKLIAYMRKSKDKNDGHDVHKVVCKEGVDCSLILSMLPIFRWEHYVGVALTLAPMAQLGSHYQPDDGIVPSDSTGKNPVLLKQKAKGQRHQGIEVAGWTDTHGNGDDGTGLSELSAEETAELDLDEELDDMDDDELDDSELAEYFENHEEYEDELDEEDE